MFGYLRFILACFVLASHTGMSIQGFNIGVFAVVCFFILAGYVVTGLCDKFFFKDKTRYLLFYLERGLRIFPQYLFILLLTLIFVSYTEFYIIDYSFINIISSLSIFPLNWSRVIEAQIMIPPAWSLAVELKAYLLLPFIIFIKKIKILLAFLSLLLFTIAAFGIINTDFYSLNTIFGTLFIFIVGSSIYKVSFFTERKLDLFDKYISVFIYLYMILLMLVMGIIFREMVFIENIMEIALGLIIGIPAVSYISKSDIKLPFNKLIGDLSYGIFLSHFLVINLIRHLTGITFSYGINATNEHVSPVLYVLVVFLISLIISIIAYYLVEVPIKKYRFSLTKRL